MSFVIADTFKCLMCVPWNVPVVKPCLVFAVRIGDRRLHMLRQLSAAVWCFKQNPRMKWLREYRPIGYHGHHAPTHLLILDHRAKTVFWWGCGGYAVQHKTTLNLHYSTIVWLHATGMKCAPRLYSRNSLAMQQHQILVNSAVDPPFLIRTMNYLNPT